MLVRALVLSCIAFIAAPALHAAQASMSEQEQREELESVLQERVRLHERRIAELEAQLEALRSGADLGAIRESLRAPAPTTRPEARPPIGDRNAEGDGRRVGERLRNRDREARDTRFRPPSQEPELTPEMIEGMLLMIRNENPVFADRLAKLREERPEAFRRIARRMFDELPRDDDELAGLGIRVRATEAALRELAERARKAEAVDETLESEVRDALNAAADARIAFESARLEREEEKLERRRGFLETMAERRSTFIEQRLQAILSGEDLVKLPRRDRPDRREGEEREEPRAPR